MKKLLLLIMLLISSLSAEVEHLYMSQKIIDSKMKIIDIRTPGEWKDTGLVKGSIPIMFFNEKGGYDIQSFLKELNSKIDTKKKFAIICNTGNRTRILADFLSKKMGYDVVDIRAGIRYAMYLKLPINPYKQ